MTDLTPYTHPTDSWVPMLGAVGDLANKVAATEFVGKGFRGKPASVAAAILTGRELNLGPMTSLRGLDVIDGRVSMSAQMMAAKIQAAGHRIDWIENTDKAAEVRIVRGDGLGEGSARWTMADAQRAGLAGKTSWAKYPRAMLKARALTECAGMVCADVLMGIESGEAVDDAPARPSGGTTVVQVTPTTYGNTATGRPEVRGTLNNDGDYSRLRPEPIEEAPAHVEPPRIDGGTTARGSESSEAHPQPTPDPAPDPITPAQMRKLQALLSDLERLEGRKLDRQERRDMIADLAGVETLATAKDLTKEQARAAIDALGSLITAAEAVVNVIDAEIVEEDGD